MQNRNLVDFNRRLRQIAGDTAIRPFLCQGSPFDCKVFLVGINPATDVPLWPYWTTKSGCDKAGWLRAYREKHGRDRPTRKRIEILCESMDPVRVLETNVFHMRSWREAELSRSQKTTSVFEFLLESLKPRIVFVHGRSAVKIIEKLTSKSITRDRFVSVKFQGVTFDVLAGNHLAYQWSYAEVKMLGERLRKRHLLYA